MLVPAMTNEEITKELTRDSLKIIQVHMPRLLETYVKERKRCKIDRHATWPKEYMVEMPKSRNTWMIIFQMCPTRTKFSNAADIVYCNLTWYYGPQGLRVFRPAKHHIEVFNAHLFNRYNERMNLNLSRHLDIIKRFFLNSGMLLPEEVMYKGKEYMMSVCREGATLGNYHSETSRPWLVNNTFITHEQMHKTQVEQKSQLFQNTLDTIIDVVKDADDLKIQKVTKQVQRFVNHIQAVA